MATGKTCTSFDNAAAALLTSIKTQEPLSQKNINSH